MKYNPENVWGHSSGPVLFIRGGSILGEIEKEKGGWDCDFKSGFTDDTGWAEGDQ